MPTRCMLSGCICCYQAFDCEDIICCCKGSGECICLFSESCLTPDEEPFDCGLVQPDEGEDECCKLGCFICICGLKQPSTFCAGSSQFLCCYGAQALPFDKKHMAEPACAYYGIGCIPECGCCITPPDCPALNKVECVPAIGVAAPSQTTMERQTNAYTGAASAPVRRTVRHEPPPETFEQRYTHSAPATTTTTRTISYRQEESNQQQAVIPIQTAQSHWAVPPDSSNTAYTSGSPPATRTTRNEPLPEPTEERHEHSVPAATITKRIIRHEPPLGESSKTHSHYGPTDVPVGSTRRKKPGHYAEDPDEGAGSPHEFMSRRKPGRHPEEPHEGYSYSGSASSPVPPQRMVIRHEPPPEDFYQCDSQEDSDQRYSRIGSIPSSPGIVTRTTRRVIPPEDSHERKPHSHPAPENQAFGSISKQPSFGLENRLASEPPATSKVRKVKSTVTTKLNADGSVTVTKETFEPDGSKRIQSSTYPNRETAASYGVKFGG